MTFPRVALLDQAKWWQWEEPELCHDEGGVGGWGVKISKGGEADYRPELTSFWREEKSYSEELMKVVAAPVKSCARARTQFIAL